MPVYRLGQRYGRCNVIRITKVRPSGQIRTRFNDDCDWDSEGEMNVHDEEGFVLNEYVPCGSIPPTYWEEMLMRL